MVYSNNKNNVCQEYATKVVADVDGPNKVMARANKYLNTQLRQ